MKKVDRGITEVAEEKHEKIYVENKSKVEKRANKKLA